MSRFLESIAIVEGQIQRLRWHQLRVDRTLNAYHKGVTLDLYAAINEPASRYTGTVKCRVLYDERIDEVQFSPYVPRPISTLRIVENNTIEYAFKFADRGNINRLMEQRANCDDILIVRKGLITDSSIANIVFRRGEQWFTPRQPLLKGTMREHLLDQGMLAEADIRPEDLNNYVGYKLINAMVEFAAEEYPVSNIQF
jgi:4-amino-4-deoxychorismate lyase